MVEGLLSTGPTPSNFLIEWWSSLVCLYKHSVTYVTYGVCISNSDEVSMGRSATQVSTLLTSTTEVFKQQIFFLNKTRLAWKKVIKLSSHKKVFTLLLSLLSLLSQVDNGAEALKLCLIFNLITHSYFKGLGLMSRFIPLNWVLTPWSPLLIPGILAVA